VHDWLVAEAKSFLTQHPLQTSSAQATQPQPV